jgi:hypothetical protein
MTSKQNTSMFLKAGPHNGTSNDLYSEIVRYCQLNDQPLLKNKMIVKMALSCTPCKEIICPFGVQARRQSCTAIWNVKQDSLNLAHMCRFTFGCRKKLKHPDLSMIYTQVGLDIPVTSKTGSITKVLQKTSFIQAGIHMKPLSPMPAARTSNQMVLFNSLDSTKF